MHFSDDLKINIAARDNMLKNQLLSSGIANKELINSFANLPKECFVSNDEKNHPYVDSLTKDSNKENRYILRSKDIAKIVLAGQIKDSDKALCIDSGSGYFAFVVAGLCSYIISLEVDQELAEKQKHLANILNIENIIIKNDDYFDKMDQNAPFDKIFLNSAVKGTQHILLSQLANNGILISLEEIESQVKAVQYQNFNGSILRTELFLLNAPKML